MKFSKLQSCSLCFGLLSGMILTVPATPMRAASHQQVVAGETTPLPQTKRVVEIHSTDDVIHRQQTDEVSWQPCKYGEFQRTSSAKLPKIEGYEHNANGMVIDKLEKIDIPLTVYHVDYFKADGKWRPTQANCLVDMKDEQGKTRVRHIYSVSYDGKREVTVNAPEGMEFVQPSSNVQQLFGKYGERKEVFVRPISSRPVVVPEPQQPSEGSEKPQKPVQQSKPQSGQVEVAEKPRPQLDHSSQSIEPTEKPACQPLPDHSVTAELKPFTKMLDKPTATEDKINKLMAYNRPLIDHDHPADSPTDKNQLPQTGNHSGRVFVALGVALMAVLGLCRSRRER